MSEKTQKNNIKKENHKIVSAHAKVKNINLTLFLNLQNWMFCSGTHTKKPKKHRQMEMIWPRGPSQ